MRREVVLVRAADRNREDAVASHGEQHAGTGVQAGERQSEEADHRADGNQDAHPFDAEVLAERGKRRVELIERRDVAGQRVGLDVGDEDEEGARQQQAGDDGAGNRLQRILRLFAERRGAFETDKAEDRDYNAQADVLQAVARGGMPLRVIDDAGLSPAPETPASRSAPPRCLQTRASGSSRT